MAMNEKPTRFTSICNRCNSKSYCANRDKGMMACNCYNKFPAPGSEDKPLGH